jgi:hypothetical protein
MADFFQTTGLRAVAVHSGPNSAPRSSSLEQLEAGELDAIFSVDMFNEGVDVPNIDTVLMLRPTESTVIWMQQFGRGLRLSEGKARLNVIDYIGNHRVFLTKARALLQCGDGDRSLALRLETLRRGEFKLPEGCEITYDLQALDLLSSLLRNPARSDALEACYLDFRARTGERPKAIDIYHAGFNPRTTGHGGWFDFVNHQGDLSLVDQEVLKDYRGLLDTLSTTQMTKSYKMLLIRAMQQEGAFPGSTEIDKLVDRMAKLAERNPKLRRDISAELSDKVALRRVIEKGPIDAWMQGKGSGGRSYFTYEDGVLASSIQASGLQRQRLNALVEELVDWRLASYLGGKGEDGDVNATEADKEFYNGAPQLAAENAALWREYMREEIPPLFGFKFNTGAWQQGFVVQGKDVFLLVTLMKHNLQEDHRYEDRFIDTRHFHWQSQNRTTQQSAHGNIISGLSEGFRTHLFVRMEKKRGLKASPFRYCGEVTFASWEGDKPISVVWKLSEPVPVRLHRSFEIASDA